VRVKLLKFSPARRARVEIALAEYREKMRDIARKMAEAIIMEDIHDDGGKLLKAGDTPEVRIEKLKKQAGLMPEFRALEDAYLKPAYLRVYVSSVEGLEIDSAPATTAEQLIEDGASELGDEVYSYIQEHGGLTAGESKPSGSDGTSEPPEGGTTDSTTATTAAQPAQ
jgi:hypothetical protein